MLGQEVLRVAGCDICFFDDNLYSRPYASLGSYHKAVIPFLKGDKALRGACCKIMLARSARMVHAASGLTIDSTIESFTES